MKKINNDVKKYISSIDKIEYFKNYIVLESLNQKYLYIEKTLNDNNINDYLNKIGFKKYYKSINSIHDNYSLFLLDDKKKNKTDLLIELYKLSSEEVMYEQKQIEKIFQRISNNITSLLNYYYSLQDEIEEMLYPIRSYYNLLINISSFYKLLHLGEYYLNNWINSNNYSYQEVLNLKNIDNNNFLGGKIVDMSLARRDALVFELANYYQKYYYEETVVKDIENFFEKTNINEKEKYLFYSLITNIEKIDKDNLEDIDNKIIYVKITYNYLLEKYKENEKRKEDVFNKKEENI